MLSGVTGRGYGLLSRAVFILFIAVFTPLAGALAVGAEGVELGERFFLMTGGADALFHEVFGPESTLRSTGTAIVARFVPPASLPHEDDATCGVDAYA